MDNLPSPEVNFEPFQEKDGNEPLVTVGMYFGKMRSRYHALETRDNDFSVDRCC
jgi:hypothetical protein